MGGRCVGRRERVPTCIERIAVAGQQADCQGVLRNLILGARQFHNVVTHEQGDADAQEDAQQQDGD